MTSQNAVAIPKTNPSTWITNNDYPVDLVVEGANGTVDFRLAVGPNGKPVNCVVITGTKWKDLDSYTCDILKQKAEFQPWNAIQEGDGLRFYRSKVFWTRQFPGFIAS